MRKSNILLASTAALALAISPAAYAQSDTEAETAATAVSGTGGAAIGAVTGFAIGGPIGAIIGGFAGASIGVAATVADGTIEYAATNPVEPMYLEDQIEVGYVFSDDTLIEPVPSEPGQGYVYANGRVFIVDTETREVIYSPGFVVPESTLAYANENPAPELDVNLDMAAGAQVPDGVQLTVVPDQPAYSYAYYKGSPVIIDSDSRMVIWAG